MAPPTRIKEIIFLILLMCVATCTAQDEGSGSTETPEPMSTTAASVVIECEFDSDCTSNAVCKNDSSNYECECKAGFTGDGTSSCVPLITDEDTTTAPAPTTAADKDECALSEDNCGENTECKNTPGSFTCDCIAAGYRRVNDTTCEDKDECTLNEDNCGENTECKNTPGSFTCDCIAAGYRRVSDTTCEDKNECTSNEDDCGANTVCVNTPGSFRCDCKDGYRKDGEKSCVDKDECALNEDNCGENTECKNTQGSFTCDCKEGYRRVSDTTCEDIDECASSDTNDCSAAPAGVCSNSPGSYSCACRTGYGGNGRNCQLIEIPSLFKISVKENSISVKVLTVLRHQIYNVEVLASNGLPVSSVNSTDPEKLVTVISGLEPGTDYRVRGRVVKLENGHDVNGKFSAELEFQTVAIQVPVNLKVEQTFVAAYEDINSPQSRALIAIMCLNLISAGGGNFIVTCVIYKLVPGSVVALSEVSTNSTANQTLSDVAVANTTLTEVPSGIDPPPGNVAVNDITTTSFLVKWDAVANATEYQVFVDGQNNASETKTTNGTSLQIPDIQPNSVVIVSVRAMIQAGGVIRFSNRSADIVVTTQAEGPEGLTLTVLNGDCITVKFNTVQSAVKYFIMLASDPALDSTISATAQVNGTLSSQIIGLNPDTMYNVTVVADVGGQNSTASTASATTGPESVSDVSVYNVSQNGFNVRYGAVNIVPAIDTTYVVKYTSMAGAQEYNTGMTDVMISAENPVTVEYNVSVAYKTTKTSSFSAPVTTKIFSVTSGTTSSVDVMWDGYKTASEFNVTLTPGSTRQVSAKMDSFTGLTPGTEYTLQVSTGETTLFTIPLLTCPAPVAGLVCRPKSLSCISVDYNSSETSFTVSVVDNQFANITVNSADSSAEICNLTTGSNNTVRVVAVNSQCSSSPELVTNCVTDIDECAPGGTNDCHSNAVCQNTVGSFSCICKAGFAGNGRDCTDVNECMEGTHNCSANANCVNLVGGFSCNCSSGYTGNGFTCTDIDECASEGTNDCHINATCTDTVGSYTCSCKPGFTGNGTYCEDANECALGTHNCSANSACENRIGGFSCNCNTGYAGNGFTCRDIDECMSPSSTNCSTQADCKNSNGSYSCQCTSGYEGDPYKPGQCFEILVTPRLVLAGNQVIVVRVLSKQQYGEYEVTVRDSSGSSVSSQTLNTTTFTFPVFTEGQFSITARIVKLSNGESVNGSASDPLIVNLNPTVIAVVVFDDIICNSSLQDRESPYFISVVETIKSRLTSDLPGYYINITILTIYCNRTGALIEAETNSSSPFTIANSTLANGSISLALTTSVTPPASLSVSEVTASGFKANWSAVASASSYVLDVACGSTSQAFYVSNTEAVAANVESNTECLLRVRAIISGTPPNITDYSNGLQVTTLAVVPNLEVTALGSSSIRVQFGFVSGASTYYISLNDSSSTSVTVDSSEISNDLFTKEITGLESGNTYLVTVTALVQDTNSTEATATVTLVSSVTGLTIFNVTKDGFDVIFDSIVLQGGTNVTYIVKYDNGTAQTLETDSTRLHIPSQPIDSPYNVSISYKTATANVSTESAPVSTAVYTIGAVTSDSISVSFEALPGVTTYTTSYSPRAPGVDPDIDPAISYTFSSLDPGTTYELLVQAYFPAVSSSIIYFEIPQATVPGTVQGLSFTATNATCVSLTWTSLGDNIQYTVTINQGTESGLAITVNNTQPGAEVCGLDTGVFYNASVYGSNAAGDGEAATRTQIVTVLPPPTNVKITVVNQTCLSVSWDNTSFAVSYTAKLEAASVSPVEMNTATPTALFCGLNAATEYNASVLAIYNAGSSSYSDAVTQITAPVAPMLTFQSASASSVSLSWSMSPTATNYYVKTMENSTATMISTLPTSDTNITVSGLMAGTVYSFVGYAENAGGNSTESSALEQITVPDAVTTLDIETENVQLNVRLNWTSTQGAESYNISVILLSNGNEVYQVSTMTNVREWNISSGLVDGESYNASVIAITGDKAVAQISAPTMKQFQTAPSTPSNVGITAITTMSFNVSWDSSQSAESYEIKVTTSGETDKMETSSNTYKVISGLVAGTVYNVTVRARNGGGWSLASAVETQITVPEAVTNLMVARPVPQTSFNAFWNASAGAAMYEITVTSSSTESDTVASTSKEFTSQAEGTRFNISVVAKTAASGFGAQQTSASTLISIMTAPSDPGTPTETDANASSISFQWGMSTGATHYNITILANDSSTAPLQVKRITDLAGKFESLEGGYCYTIQVQAFNDFGSSGIIKPELCTSPVPPDFSVTDVTQTSISIAWVDVQGENGYILGATRTSDGQVISLATTFFRGTTAEVPGLDPGTEYTIAMETVGRSRNSEKKLLNQLTDPATPENLVCTPSTATCFSLSWTAVNTAINYTSQINNGSAANVIVTVNNTKPGAEVCNVTTGSLYNASVYATNTAGDGLPASITGCYSTLPAPVNVVIEVQNQTCFTVRWDEIATAKFYTVKLTNSTVSPVEASPSTNSITLCGLKPGIVYNAVVSATYEAGESDNSTEESQITAPEEPTLMFQSATTTSITLSWTSSATTNTYYVAMTQIDPSGSSSTMSATSTVFEVPSLQPGTVYSFVVYAENGGGNSTASNTVEQITVPDAVSNFQATTFDVQLMVTFSWSVVSGAANYNLSVVKDGVEVAQTSETGTSWNGITGIQSGESYNITIIAYTAARAIVQASAPNTISFMTAPPTPASISIQRITTSGFEVSWATAKSATMYQVRVVERFSNGTDGMENVENVTSLSKAFSSLSAGTLYAVTVRAKNDGGWSTFSTESVQITVPEKVTNLVVTRPVYQTEFTLRWDETTGGASFEITITGGGSTVTQTSPTPTIRFTSQSPGTNYTTTVVAKTATAGVGTQQTSAPTTLDFRTAPEDPSTPTLISRTSESLELRWFASAGADNYNFTAIVKDSGVVFESKNVANNQTSVTGLSSGTQYTINIFAGNAFGTSQIITGDFWTLPNPPEFNTSATTTTITVVWLAIPDTFGYGIEVMRTSDKQTVTLESSLIRDSTTTTVSGLNSGTNYTISMFTAGNNANSGERSKIQITVPVATVITLTGRDANSLTYKWDMVTGASSYSIEYKIGSGTATTTSVTTSPYTIPSLQPGTVYSVTISSTNSAGSSPTSVQHSTVISTGPSFSLSEVTTTGFKVIITDVTDRASFDILLSPGSFTFNTASTSYTITTLSPGVTYSVSVVVKYDIVGQSSGSVAQNITTLISAPVNFRVISNTDTEGITLGWDTITAATSYIVNISPSTASMFNQSFNAPPALITTELGITYNFTLRAVNADGALGDMTPLNNIASQSPKMFTFEHVLNSTFEYTDDLRNKSSAAYLSLVAYLESIFKEAWANVNGITSVIEFEFLRGIVVVRVTVPITNPNTTDQDLITAFDDSTADKSAFNSTGQNFTDSLNECLNIPSVCHSEATCTNTEASYTCSCNMGYSGNGTTCTDINECSASSSPCDPNANCANNKGSYSCTCKTGYTGNGTSCSDVNECSTSSPCGGTSTCENTQGSFKCNCPDGYVYESNICTDVNECTSSNPCVSNADCTNTVGSFMCECREGYTGDGTASCSDIDECTVSPSVCTANQTCQNTIGSYNCPCRGGYMENADRSDCVDINECSPPSPCHDNATCSNNVGSYSCSCNVGYTGNGTSCVDVDECADTNICGSNATCSNNDGSYTCNCKSGFTKDSMEQCLDDDECATPNRCQANAACVNTVGSFKCDCNSGYVLNGTVCDDIDECKLADDNNCIERATCANTPGSYQCNCKPGFTGSNNVCEDIDECKSTPCPSTDICYNTIGSYLCNCTGGYALNETTNGCQNVNECVKGSGTCPANRNCRDTEGSYTCDCSDGYSGETCDKGASCGNCSDVNECTVGSDNCDANADCSNTEGSFLCQCKQYYSGTGTVCEGNITILFLTQTISKYDYSPDLSRATVTKPTLDSEVKTEVERIFPDFTFVSASYSSGPNTTIIVLYVIQTAMPVSVPVNIALYYVPNRSTGLFSNDPVLAENCTSLDCANGYCYNYVGSETCGCFVGYSLNNNQCIDVDECTNGQAQCHGQATCTNSAGSYICNCNAGYTGNGRNCDDINECTLGTFQCTANADCNNTAGSYTCVCRPGYLETSQGTCKGQCDDPYCNNGGTCVPSTTSDTPTCQCTGDFQGTTCNESSVYRNLAIAFGVIGGILLIALIVAIIVYVVKRKRGGRDFVP